MGTLRPDGDGGARRRGWSTFSQSHHVEAVGVKKHNSWIGALWALGIVLVVAGWACIGWQYSFYYQGVDSRGTEPVVEFLLSIANTVSNPAILVGFATMGGLLFLHGGNHARKVTRERSGANLQR